MSKNLFLFVVAASVVSASASAQILTGGKFDLYSLISDPHASSWAQTGSVKTSRSHQAGRIKPTAGQSVMQRFHVQ